MTTNIPTNWTQGEINEYFNIRLNNIEKFMPLLISSFENTIPDEESIMASAALRASVKTEMISTMNAIRDKIKKK